MMTSTIALQAKSVGFVLTRRYCIYDEVNDFSYLKRIDYMPVYDDVAEVFRIYLFSLKDALHVIDFIMRRNLDAVFVHIL